MSQDLEVGSIRFLAAVLDLDLRPLRALQDQKHPRRSPVAPADYLVHCCWTTWFATLDSGRVLPCVQAGEPVVRPANVACAWDHFDAVCNNFLPYI